MTVISGQTVPEKTQCGKIGLWLLEGSIIKNISEYTTMGSRSGKPYIENSRSAALADIRPTILIDPHPQTEFTKLSQI